MLPPMSTLLLIRHGQASFGQANYDQLSPLGERQAAITGRHLDDIGARADVLLSGRMQRQHHTAALAGDAWHGNTDIGIDPAFDEYDADGLFKAYLPAVLMENPELAARQRELLADRKLFQRAFEGVTAKWLAGETHEAPAFESWRAFNTRVREGLAALHRDHDRDARLAVFTSGGPISVAVASALDLSDREAIRLNWTIYNASVTELRSTRTGWRLMGFNSIAHLRLENDPEVVTLR